MLRFLYKDQTKFLNISNRNGFDGSLAKWWMNLIEFKLNGKKRVTDKS